MLGVVITPVVPALGRLRQQYCKPRASLEYIVRPHLQNTTSKLRWEMQSEVERKRNQTVRTRSGQITGINLIFVA
jgi:hypothetical protein